MATINRSDYEAFSKSVKAVPAKTYRPPVSPAMAKPVWASAGPASAKPPADLAAMQAAGMVVNPFDARQPNMVVIHPAAPIAPPVAAPVKAKGPSLRSFVGGTDEFEGSFWTHDAVRAAFDYENWRVRDVGEAMKEGDVVAHGGDAPWYERISGLKDSPLTQEMIDLHGFEVWTLEGGGKPKKPIVWRSTVEFDGGLMSVPKGARVSMPTDENEARRFFGCDVIVTEIVEKGKATKVFCPILSQYEKAAFRRAFSQVFPEYAKKVLRDHIKGLIHGRGDGLVFKRGFKVNMLRRLSEGTTLDMELANKLKLPIRGKTPAGLAIIPPMTADEIGIRLNLPVSLINTYLSRQDYTRRDGPIVSFADRMAARNLVPGDYGYDKAIGIEIETVTPYGIEYIGGKNPHARSLVPSFVRMAQDGSIRADAENDVKPDNNKTFGVEFRVLIKRSEMEGRVLKAIEAIGNLGAKVNRSCGLHIHFDMRGKTFDQFTVLHKRVKSWLILMQEMVPPSRRNNKYCTFADGGGGNDHWEAVSTRSFKQHQTMEVRLHSATLNPVKVIQWIRLIETIMETKFLPLPKTTCLDALKQLSLTEADRTYWLKRHQQLNPTLYKGGKLDLGFLGDRAVDEQE